MSCIRVCAGDFDRTINIVNRTKVPADYGDVDAQITQTTIKRVWAKQESKGGVVIFDSANNEAILTDIFWIRYINNIDITNSIIYNGNNYTIIDIENVNGNNEYLKIKTSKKGDYTIKTNLV